MKIHLLLIVLFSSLSDMVLGQDGSQDTGETISLNATIVPQHWVFEYVDAFFDGLDADYYVNGSAVCAFNF